MKLRTLEARSDLRGVQGFSTRWRQDCVQRYAKVLVGLALKCGGFLCGQLGDNLGIAGLFRCCILICDWSDSARPRGLERVRCAKCAGRRRISLPVQEQDLWPRIAWGCTFGRLRHDGASAR